MLDSLENDPLILSLKLKYELDFFPLKPPNNCVLNDILRFLHAIQK